MALVAGGRDEWVPMVRAFWEPFSALWLISPSLPSSGIHEIMRMMFEVQNGTVQIRKSPSASSGLRTWNTRK